MVDEKFSKYPKTLKSICLSSIIILWTVYIDVCHALLEPFFYKKNHGKRYSSCEISMSQNLSLFVMNSCVTWLTCHIMRLHQSLHLVKVVKPAFKRRNVTLSSHIPSQRLRHFYLLRHYNFLLIFSTFEIFLAQLLVLFNPS